MQHTLVKHENCRIPNCAICSGAAKVCSVCGCTSPRLTTTCVGIPLTRAQITRVHEGTLDFVKGFWKDSRNGDLIDDKVKLKIGDTFEDKAKKTWVYVGAHATSEGTRQHHFAEAVVDKYRHEKQGYRMVRYMPQLAALFPAFKEDE